MLDYAANAVVYWPVDRIRLRFETNCEKQGSEPDERLRDFLKSEVEPEEFWQKANTNLLAGRVRLLFMADIIPPRLQRIVEFLNAQMNPAEVLAVEIKQFVGQGLRSLVPRVIGQTVEAQEKRLPTPPISITETEFFLTLEETTSAQNVDVARKILNWSKQNSSYVRWRIVSFAPVFEYDSKYPLIPTGVSISGKVGINFGRMKRFNRLPDEKLMEILHRLNDIDGIKLPEGSIKGKPVIPLSTLADDRGLEQFLKTIAWTVEEVKAAQQQQDTAVPNLPARS